MTDKSPFIRTLQRRDALSPTDLALIEAMPLREVDFAHGEEIVSEGDRPNESCLVIQGFAARSQQLSGGQRQLTAVHVPGDFVDLHSLLLKVMDHSVIALGACRAAFVPHSSVRALVDASPHLGRMLWLSTLIDGAIQRTWITCLGRRSAEQHMAHLICELYLRLEAAGKASGWWFDFPITQYELGDILGLSTVHVNRKLQELRNERLVEWRNGRIVILDFTRLSQLAEFDPTYLSLEKLPR